jgi:hypothetical protein
VPARTAAADVMNDLLGWTGAHHLTAWTDGGPTNLDNPRSHYLAFQTGINFPDVLNSSNLVNHTRQDENRVFPDQRSPATVAAFVSTPHRQDRDFG